jgi:hypothetical protein
MHVWKYYNEITLYIKKRKEKERKKHCVCVPYCLSEVMRKHQAFSLLITSYLTHTHTHTHTHTYTHSKRETYLEKVRFQRKK